MNQKSDRPPRQTKQLRVALVMAQPKDHGGGIERPRRTGLVVDRDPECFRLNGEFSRQPERGWAPEDCVREADREIVASWLVGTDMRVATQKNRVKSALHGGGLAGSFSWSVRAGLSARNLGLDGEHGFAMVKAGRARFAQH